MTHRSFPALVVVLLTVLAAASPAVAQVIPFPPELRQSVEETPVYRRLVVPPALKEQGEVLRNALAKLGHTIELSIEEAGAKPAPEPKKATPALRFGMFPNMAEGQYSIRFQRETGDLVVQAESPTAAAHAAASLIQLVLPGKGGPRWRRVYLSDAPMMSHRSFMVDMGRNPHSPETLRRVVDVMWFYKLNYLQLHLTDDQLFSWPSTAFPKLTSPRAGWTREDFVALEAYARARGVAIIPELEVPGHSSILRRTYPEVFGKTPTELASRPEALKGVQTLIDELLEVFSSTPYVHIGGDEAYGVPQQIQRDFINRLNAFVKSRGRRTIVWEGPRPGEGDQAVDRDVIHICWRAIEFPPAEMLARGHEVIAAPWDPLYIVDHYPRTMFTAVDLERIYTWDPRVYAHVNPGMRNFHEPPRAEPPAINGFCMPWWEGREENLGPICFPRLAAVSAASWRPVKARVPFAKFMSTFRTQHARLAKITDLGPTEIPRAPATEETGNHAFGATVTTSTGAAMPWFGPDRLVNGITDRFDHFLGYPTKPKPLEITLALREPAELRRVIVHERAVRGSHEVYRLLASEDGETFSEIGSAVKGTRGVHSFVVHRFAPRRVTHLRLVTEGCEGLTFPSFSRLSEIEAFGF